MPSVQSPQITKVAQPSSGTTSLAGLCCCSRPTGSSQYLTSTPRPLDQQPGTQTGAYGQSVLPVLHTNFHHPEIICHYRKDGQVPQRSTSVCDEGGWQGDSGVYTY